MAAPHNQKGVDFLNTHTTYEPEQHFCNRTFVCAACGFMRRSPGSSPAPAHCEAAMSKLSHPQAVAARRLTPAKRVEWWRSGGHIRAAGGKRKWRTTGKPPKSLPIRTHLAA